ncbi:MAG: PEGA domain-containing protein, partial [Magnetococcales bacterium]|nr:PEGA domain-containing protein [Magnetococcales bacterium]
LLLFGVLWWFKSPASLPLSTPPQVAESLRPHPSSVAPAAVVAAAVTPSPVTAVSVPPERAAPLIAEAAPPSESKILAPPAPTRPEVVVPDEPKAVPAPPVRPENVVATERNGQGRPPVALEESGENAVKVKPTAVANPPSPPPVMDSGTGGEFRSVSTPVEGGVVLSGRAEPVPEPPVAKPNPPGTPPRLTVTSDPEGATIRILNISSPYRPGMTLAPGAYQIEVSHPGYITNLQWVTLRQADLVVPITLEKPSSSTYGLTVNTKPARAKVQVVNIRARYRPGIQLPPGKYQIHVSHPGYKTQEMWIDLDEELTLPITLQPDS